MSAFEIVKYTPVFKSEWDNFIRQAKNATFILERAYMDYHADRFEDFSLIIRRYGKIYALFPANRKEDILYSHTGLTYGGLIMNKKCVTEEIIECFKLLGDYIHNCNINSIIYKPSPHIYHSLPSEEDLYALFRADAVLVGRNVASVIFNEDRIKFREIRKYGIKKALKEGVTVEESEAWQEYWNILDSNLRLKYQTAPVHSFAEIFNLKNKFPEEIKLFVAKREDRIIGGVVCYISTYVVHVQYISASPEGKENGAIDLIFDFLLNKKYHDRRYFDFGTSNENGGKYLNKSLIYQKEGFGGRAICYDTYYISTKKLMNLNKE